MHPPYHTAVLIREVIESLQCRSGGIYVDGTVGGGGHAFAILEQTAPDGLLVGIDRDDDALAEAGRCLRVFGSRVRLIKGNFADIGDILGDQNVTEVDGILLDLGVSSHQVDTPERGFSFHQDAPLDMRMDQSHGMDARTLVNTYPEKEIAAIIWEFGEERMARRIARAIMAKRGLAPIQTTGELVSIVESVMPARMKAFKIHPATRTFQAIRIAVNQELANLRRGLQGSIDVLKPGGRLSVISFHSLEDRMVKEQFAFASSRCVCPPDLPVCSCGKKAQLKVITRKPVTPGEAEMASNPRSRSAKLRTAERI
ncbi:MAG: 16S rRNA (cytosine(1402)-N(4))-methyltransferase RsmH [Syntrophales bacterium]|nr:16S rRNA (cytosine(1402)-N(4))-methyltransferase RsmH [Syntrophales bacterium]